MKKNLIIFAVFAATVLLASCSKSIEKQAQKLAEEKIKAALYIPKSYDLASFELDSAFAPYDDPEFFELSNALFEASNEYEKTQREVKSAESSMALWGGPYQTSMGAVEYKQAKEKYDEAQAKIEKITEYVQSTSDNLKTMLEGDDQFIGYKALLTYRAKNNAGQVGMSTVKVLFDKDMTKVLQIYDTDDESYEVYASMINMIEQGQ